MSLSAHALTTELELADRARRGDHPALVQLYRTHHDALLRHARRMLNDDNAARDMVQEAFTRAIVAMPKTREELRFRAWIFRIVTNLCLRELTRRNRTRPDTIGDDRAAPAEATSPDRGVRRSELGVLVERALKRMPPRYRQILLLREVQELSYEELSDVLEMNKTSVKVTLHRARQRFAALFIGERLIENPEIDVNCDELKTVRAEDDQRAIERHLESCNRCRKEDRPAAELFALLPPLPAFSPTPPWEVVGPAPAATTAAAAGSTKLATAAWIAGGAMAITGAALVALVGLSSNGDAAAPKLPAAKPQTSNAKVSNTTPAPAVATQPSAVKAQPSKRARKRVPVAIRPVAIRPVAIRPVATRAKPKLAAKKAKTAPLSKDIANKIAAKAGLPALRVKLRVVANTAWAMRKGKKISISKKSELARGDVIHTRRGQSLAMVVPGHQWITFSGALELVDVAEEGEPASTVRVRLLKGALRARAGSRGGGLRILVGKRTVKANHGEFRLRLRASALRVESVSAHVTVRGPHAARTISAGAGATLDGRPGFSHALPASATQLRPTRHQGERAPLLRWVGAAKRYRVVIARDADFLLPEEVKVVEGSQYQPKLKRHGKHFWKVQAIRDSARGKPSKIYSFVIER